LPGLFLYNELRDPRQINLRYETPWFSELLLVNLKRIFLKLGWGSLVGVFLSVLMGFLCTRTNLWPELEFKSYDWPFLLRAPITPTEAIMVYMDDESHTVLGQPFNKPWDRQLHARLLDRLREDPTRAVVFDIVFSDPADTCLTNNTLPDEVFARAIQANGRVILAADVVPAGYGETLVKGNRIYPPIPELIDATAMIASAETHPEKDLLIRRHLPQSKKEDQIPGLSWAAAEMVGASVTAKPDARFAPRWLNDYGAPTTITNVSYHRALSTNDVPLGTFRDKVVFVGARIFTKFAGQRKDEYPHPYAALSPYKFMPGVEIQATQFLNLVRGDWLGRLSERAEFFTTMLLCVVLGYGFVQLRPTVVTAVAVVAGAGVAVAGYYSFKELRVWFPWVIIEVIILTAWLWSVAYNSLTLLFQKRLLEQSLSMYLSPKLVKKFAGQPELLKPGAEKQMLTILFSDIEGFTTISEGMDSDDLATLMNRYFENAVSKCIHLTDGTVVKYIGDAIFAFWNAPEHQLDHAARACEAALLLSKQVVTFSKNETTWCLRTRIGLHAGVANVGNFGSHTRVDYTALGESINLASRMEGLNKYMGTGVLITRDTEALVRDRFVTRYLGELRLKGFEKAVGVYELVAGVGQPDGSAEAREAFAAALKLFREKRFDEAETAFHRVLALKPNDGPAKFYLARLDEFRTHTPPADWAGEIELKEK